MGVYIFPVLLTLLGLFVLSRVLRRIRLLKADAKTYRHFYYAPRFNPDALDCYMRFQGRVASPDQYRSSLARKAYAASLNRVQAHWTTKKKRPDKGMQENVKTLCQQGQGEFTLVNQAGQCIVLNLEKLQRNQDYLLQISSVEREQADCPAHCQDKALAKYRRYSLREWYVRKGDMLSAYGCLRYDKQGRLTLLPSGDPAYPSGLFNRAEVKDPVAWLHTGYSKVQTEHILMMLFLAFIGGWLTWWGGSMWYALVTL